jgi:hypothetical protein
MIFKVIQPASWAGQQKGGPDSPMVCGACPDWRACEAADRCARASDEDYTRANGQIDRWQGEGGR